MTTKQILELEKDYIQLTAKHIYSTGKFYFANPDLFPVEKQLEEFLEWIRKAYELKVTDTTKTI